LRREFHPAPIPKNAGKESADHERQADIIISFPSADEALKKAAGDCPLKTALLNGNHSLKNNSQGGAWRGEVGSGPVGFVGAGFGEVW
jgi:hypothetical protein